VFLSQDSSRHKRNPARPGKVAGLAEKLETVTFFRREYLGRSATGSRKEATVPSFAILFRPARDLAGAVLFYLTRSDF